MRKFFEQLKIRHKILISFIVVQVLLLVFGIREYNFFHSYKDQVTKIYTFSDINNLLSQSIQMVYNKQNRLNSLVNSKNKNETKANWKIQQQILQNYFLNNLELRKITDNLKQSYPKIEEMNLFLKQIENSYQKEIKQEIDKIYNLRLNLFSKEDVNLSIDSILLLPPITNEANEILKYDLESISKKLSHYWEKEEENFIKYKTEIQKELWWLREQNEKKDKKNRTLGFILILCGFVFSIGFAFFLANDIARPLQKLSQKLEKLAKGDFPEKSDLKTSHEIQTMADAVNRLTQNLEYTRDFAIEVGKGHFNTQINVFHNETALGKALGEMRDGLYKVAIDREKQHQKEEKRNWATRGLAQFADILQKENDNIERLSDNIIKNMVRYMEANQGGLFVINDSGTEEPFIELVSSFAYNRKKSQTKTLKMNEGLVGRCVSESETVHMIDIPDSYINITSGLGDSNPRSLLIVPLKLNEEIFGVIEIASFKEFETHHIEFVEKVGENIASTLSAVKMNAQTSDLLEQAQENAEEMAAQEEELRQNLEELQATQEDAARKEAMAIGFVNSVNHTIIRADYNLKGNLLYANSRFLENMGYTSQEIAGQHISMFLREEDRGCFLKQWDKLSEGGRHYEKMVCYKQKDGEAWFLASYTVVRDKEGYPIKILYLAFNVDEINSLSQNTIDEQKMLIKQYQKQIGLLQETWENHLIEVEKKYFNA